MSAAPELDDATRATLRALADDLEELSLRALSGQLALDAAKLRDDAADDTTTAHAATWDLALAIAHVRRGVRRVCDAWEREFDRSARPLGLEPAVSRMFAEQIAEDAELMLRLAAAARAIAEAAAARAKGGAACPPA